MIQEEQNLQLWKFPHSSSKYELAEICEKIRPKMNDPFSEWEVGVGTDSQIKGKHITFTTVICVYQRGKGGHYFFKNEEVCKKQFKSSSQAPRMFEEVNKTVQVALEIEKLLAKKPLLHIDASKANNKEAYTSAISDQLKGYAIGFGFECVLKPDSYVASCIADRHSKKI
jgi:predicted RNase H-related nuclease YkuK (DUF458 family)